MKDPRNFSSSASEQEAQEQSGEMHTNNTIGNNINNTTSNTSLKGSKVTSSASLGTHVLYNVFLTSCDE